MTTQSDNTAQKVHLAAITIAMMLEDWPEMTWEDARALNRHSQWIYAHHRYDGLSAIDCTTGAAGRLSADGLKRAWEIAHGIWEDRLQ